MTNLGKAITVLSGIGAVGGSLGLGIHLLNKNPTLQDKLISEGFELASTNEEWTALLTAHELLKAPDDNIFKEQTNTNKDKEWLKNKCQQALKSSKENKINYNLAIQWCVKETKVNNILGKTKKILSTSEQTDDSRHWSQKINLLKENQNAITALEIAKEKNSILVSDLKSKCGTILETKTTAKTFHKNLQLAKEWCVTSEIAN